MILEYGTSEWPAFSHIHDITVSHQHNHPSCHIPQRLDGRFDAADLIASCLLADQTFFDDIMSTIAIFLLLTAKALAVSEFAPVALTGTDW